MLIDVHSGVTTYNRLAVSVHMLQSSVFNFGSYFYKLCKFVNTDIWTDHI